MTSVDVSHKAVQVMAQRGFPTPIVGDVFDVYPDPFDTVFVILNIGIVRNLDGLDRILKNLDSLLVYGGQLITDSVDPRNPSDKAYRKYQKDEIANGYYLGGRTLGFEYQGKISDWFEWVHIDPETLAEHGALAGWNMQTLGTDGNRFLVRITRNP